MWRRSLCRQWCNLQRLRLFPMMDRSLLWNLKAAVTELKPESEVFLAARTPSSSAEAYAEAYEKYRRTMDAVFQYAEEEDEADEDLDSIQFDFPVRLGFRAMAAKDGGAVFSEELTFDELASFLYTDLYKGMAAGNVPRRCHNCKHFFLTVGGHDTVYCPYCPGRDKMHLPSGRRAQEGEAEKSSSHPQGILQSL